MKIIKRDGRIVDFDTEKIVNAMTKARTDVYKLTDDFVSFTNTVAKDILDETKEDKMTVEEVQDYVEDRLLHSKYKETARDYIRYRQKRTDARKSTIDDVVNEIVEDKNVLTFNNPKEVLHQIKDTGVNAINNESWTKGKLKEFEMNYPKQENGCVELTYNPIYVVLKNN